MSLFDRQREIPSFLRAPETSTSWNDPDGVKPPSTRDVIAAHAAAQLAGQIAGAHLAKGNEVVLAGRQIGLAAYKFADEVLAARKALDEESLEKSAQEQPPNGK